ncbi:group II truncated hemoglobin [Novosphingobium sp. G106]|uniref:group II truncated hemoglobin n=1 Tax=Novosphingobium sp. G106 TaxID=2849500 RepID=UPI001C2D63AB|nr:group II truncated hemoglobin [Novosphingobium sp. G106]MBV1691959.1 group II truncated hemoglobin [Novosphingobium sp. G106]
MQTSTQATAQPRTAYDLVGGRSVVRDFVDRFYDLMAADPAYAELRALHAPDLAPMRASLTDFLSAWLGGPRDWFDERPGVCMMSAHRGVAMSEAAARQWAEAMTRAVTERVPDKGLADKLAEALSSMALGMAGVEAA